MSAAGQIRKSGAAAGRSAVEGEADPIGGKADIDLRMSGISGKAEVAYSGRSACGRRTHSELTLSP